MGTLRQRLFASFTVLSLIACLATVGLWVRSYSRSDTVYHISITQTEFAQQAYSSHVGVLNVDLLRFPEARPEIGGGGRSFWRVQATEPNRDLAGFDYFQNDSVLRFTIPLWLPALLFALAPTYWLFGPRRRRAKRRKLGLCLTCGYDLRVQLALSKSNVPASPQRCPECGTPSTTLLAH
ncbi:MAG: hypothetical protein H7Z14_15210 [Anaerolineae bacterium]|nr:hypothetical protein [Phycisphaerae bacterium]